MSLRGNGIGLWHSNTCGSERMDSDMYSSDDGMKGLTMVVIGLVSCSRDVLWSWTLSQMSNCYSDCDLLCCLNSWLKILWFNALRIQ